MLDRPQIPRPQRRQTSTADSPPIPAVALETTKNVLHRAPTYPKLTAERSISAWSGKIKPSLLGPLQLPGPSRSWSPWRRFAPWQMGCMQGAVGGSNQRHVWPPPPIAPSVDRRCQETSEHTQVQIEDFMCIGSFGRVLSANGANFRHTAPRSPAP